jgi:(E)-4-hydroxy-3-methylbut-2-enyl-diphosphate synthase
MNKRDATKRIMVGNVPVGGGAPVSVQSMCNTKTADTEATLAQISAFAAAGCDIVRLAVPDMDAAVAISAIRERSKLPSSATYTSTISWRWSAPGGERTPYA